MKYQVNKLMASAVMNNDNPDAFAEAWKLERDVGLADNISNISACFNGGTQMRYYTGDEFHGAAAIPWNGRQAVKCGETADGGWDECGTRANINDAKSNSNFYCAKWPAQDNMFKETSRFNRCCSMDDGSNKCSSHCKDEKVIAGFQWTDYLVALKTEF